jgi:signal transduction histidine kinase
MKTIIEKYVIYTCVSLVGLMIILMTLFSQHNRDIALESVSLKEEGENVIHNSNRFLTQFLQAIDQSLRAYALTKEKVHLTHFNNAVRDIKPVFEDTKTLLQHQMESIPESQQTLDSLLKGLYVVKDSLDSYVIFCRYMVKLVDSDSLTKFKKFLNEDRGMIPFKIWYDYQLRLIDFEKKIEADADIVVAKAARRNSILQFSLIVFGLPTLAYVAWLISKTFRLHERIRQIEADNLRIVTEQNVVLEKKVEERTRDILTQNEEIISLNEELKTQQQHIEQQRDLLSWQNEELKQIKAIIEEQNEQIKERNSLLEKEVLHRTDELSETNKELGEYTYQLEQFAFITAHNLRSPIARIMGLGELLKLPNVDGLEREEIIKRMVQSSVELDSIIRDLNTILEIKKGQIQAYVKLKLSDIIEKNKRLLTEEIVITKAKIIEMYPPEEVVVAFPPYVDSIIFNLISNAIKYRHPNRLPEIYIESKNTGDFICITIRDNGLGIDMTKYKDRIFDLYKRFHLHVEGKGLGLYLVKSQIAAMGGRVEVESEPDKGTTFILYFRNYTDIEQSYEG